MWQSCFVFNCLSDIDQWNKVTELFGTPSESFLSQLQPSVSAEINMVHRTFEVSIINTEYWNISGQNVLLQST